MDKARVALCSSLRRDVAYLCRDADRHWNGPIARTLHEIRETSARAVFFGGTLRSLLLGRLRNGRMGRPRDIDIVVEGISIDELRAKFQRFISRETRFGGLQLQRMQWQFDVWPLSQTWAFRQDESLRPSFASLPATTFFNLEAIAIDVWPQPGHPRTIYCGDGRFFDGVTSRIIEINREENPFPGLCVVRALIMASSLDFAMGSRLAKYVATHGPTLSGHDLETIQCKHYGSLRRDPRILSQWIECIQRRLDYPTDVPIKLPIRRQREFWSESNRFEASTLRLRVL